MEDRRLDWQSIGISLFLLTAVVKVNLSIRILVERKKENET